MIFSTSYPRHEALWHVRGECACVGCLVDRTNTNKYINNNKNNNETHTLPREWHRRLRNAKNSNATAVSAKEREGERGTGHHHLTKVGFRLCINNNRMRHVVINDLISNHLMCAHWIWRWWDRKYTNLPCYMRNSSVWFLWYIYILFFSYYYTFFQNQFI